MKLAPGVTSNINGLFTEERFLVWLSVGLVCCKKTVTYSSVRGSKTICLLPKVKGLTENWRCVKYCVEILS